MSTFRPSAQAFLWIRVDELADTAQFDRTVGAQNTGPAATAGGAATLPVLATARQLSDPARALNGITESLAQLAQNQARGDLSDAEAEIARRNLVGQRELLLQEQQSPSDQPRPWILLGASPDRRFGRFGITPMSVEIQKNGYRTADTATMSLDWRTLPFDPRIVRAAAAEIVIGVVDEDDFARGIVGQADPVTGMPLSVIQQNPGAPTTSSVTRFVGWVDEWGIAYADDNIVQLEFRDFTSLFLDTPLASDYVLNLDLPIDKAIIAMIANYPSVAGLVVRYVPVPGRSGTGVAPSLGRAVPVTSRSRRGRNARSGRSGDQRMSLWDHITDACVALGVVPVVSGYEVHIVEPVTQYRTQDVRRMVYGRNLSKLDFTRKLGGTKVPTIELRSYDPTVGRLRWARWPVRSGERAFGVLGVDAPPRALRANEMSPSGSRPDERVQTYVIKPSTDPSTMVRAARSMFEQIGRQEIEGSFETNDVSSWDIDTDESRSVKAADLLALKPGDALELLVSPQSERSPQDNATTPGGWIGMERAQRARFLMSLGMTRSVAENVSALQDVVATMLFRVQASSITFDADEGVRVQCDFANFIEVREARADDSAAQFRAAQLVSPDRQAAAAAAAAAGLDAVVAEILTSSSGRQTALELAMTSEVKDGYPVSQADPRVQAKLARLVADEIAVNSILEGL